MQLYRNMVLAGLACWLLSSLPLFSASQALIVLGTTGDPSVTETLSKVAQDIRDGLIARGFAPEAIEILKAQTPQDKVTAERVRQSLKKRETLASGDEFWLVLLGFSGRTDEGKPAFQVSGPRLTAADLKTALDAIPARQFVFIGTSDSGGFVPVLLTKERPVLAATREEGEIDLPRFPEGWAAALKEKPQAGWTELAARAAVLTGKIYDDNNLAEGEHARLGEPASGRILEAPFGFDATASASEKPETGGPMELINAADIKVVIRQPNAEWEKQPATPETKKLIEQARSTPNPEGFSSIILEQRLGYKLGSDRMAEDFVMRRIYLAKEDGVARWANFLLQQNPPAVTTKLEAARIIQPDGSSTVFNPEKMPPASDCSTGLCGALTTVFMPGAKAGCIVEIAYRTRHVLDAGMPNDSTSLAVQQDVPVLKAEVQLQVPTKSKLHFKFRNTDSQPVQGGADGMTTMTWNLGALPAYEPLPFDPPAKDAVVALEISSLESWDAFAAWYLRLAKGSDVRDDTIKTKAQELASGATTRLDKIRRVYEFVSALRYVAIEFGINGIRPRTPALVLENRYGDCKDKANLLIALLAEMNIEARFCVLNRGSSTDVSFPSWQFNHAIAYVPKAEGQPDDLWLDTTDSTAPFPTLAPGDIGRNALVFEKDSAHFLPVAAVDGDVTTISEQWKVSRVSGPPGERMEGTVLMTWTGLAGYEKRSLLRGATPKQRDYLMQKELGQEMPNAAFSEIKPTSVDDLSHPLEMEARVTWETITTFPQPGPPVMDYFVSPERDRPLLINNGQKLHFIQTIELDTSKWSGGSQMLAPAFDQQVGGVHATVKWGDLGTTSTRTAELTIDQPEISSADYGAVRKMLREWVERLKAP